MQVANDGVAQLRIVHGVLQLEPLLMLHLVTQLLQANITPPQDVVCPVDVLVRKAYL